QNTRQFVRDPGAKICLVTRRTLVDERKHDDCGVLDGLQIVGLGIVGDWGLLALEAGDIASFWQIDANVIVLALVVVVAGKLLAYAARFHPDNRIQSGIK